MCCSKSWAMIGGVLAGIGVILGAYAAHGLGEHLAGIYGGETRVVAGQTIPAAQKYLTDFRTGVTYQMYHSLGLIAVGLLSFLRPAKSLQVAAWFFVVGILLFSGSLYVIAFQGPHWLGVRWGLVAPFGGVSYILGWFAFAMGACHCGMKTESVPEVHSLN